MSNYSAKVTESGEICIMGVSMGLLLTLAQAKKVRDDLVAAVEKLEAAMTNTNKTSSFVYIEDGDVNKSGGNDVTTKPTIRGVIK